MYQPLKSSTSTLMLVIIYHGQSKSQSAMYLPNILLLMWWGEMGIRY